MILATAVLGLATTVSVCVIYFSGLTELSPGFELSQSIGPIYLDYAPGTNYREFLLKTRLNTKFWYIDGHWDLRAPLSAYYSHNAFMPPRIAGWSSIEGGVIKMLYTSNYMYPLLTDQSLPLAKTFLGNFQLGNGESIILDHASYLKYFGEGVLDVYRYSANKLLNFGSNDQNGDELFGSFREWYDTWANDEQFKMYRHLYFPTDRDYPDWITLVNIVKESYPNSSSLTPGEIWEESYNYYNFSTISFVETYNKISLFNADPTFWVNEYSCEQAMFMYYDTLTQSIDFWTPADLTLSHDIRNIASLIEKKPEEVLAIFAKWLHTTDPLYFNYIGSDGFDWPNDPWHDIGYVY